ncbi:MAG: threonine synthase [Gammaproteobacteria bacterium]|nr:threonine synthase [Gammaproteobacteria bacterium]
MRYISTRGGMDPVRFREAVIIGQAPDGGLLLPEFLPDVSSDLEGWRGLAFEDLAFEVVRLFADDIDDAVLKKILKDAFETFASEDRIPLVQLDGLNVLELFHGPTLAFKDVALQVLGGLFEHILGGQTGRLNILGATSGDTGSAAIAAVRGRPNIDIFVLFPEGRTSLMQELQMTTVLDDNVHCLGIDGTFDDCQELMKSIFNDLAFKEKYRLGAVNSVNWARVVVQVVYYIYAALKFKEPVSFSVPTGNFGNVFAGYLARSMGVPIDRLVLATNKNDILARFFETGIYARGTVQHTLSPSMDIQVASNFERFLYLYFDGDSERLVKFLETFHERGSANVDHVDSVEPLFLATSVGEEETVETIKSTYAAHGYVLDPHSAVGVAAASRFKLTSPLISLATAHPAKFPDAVNEAIGQEVATHAELERLVSQATRKTVLAADEHAVKNYLTENAR